MSFFIVLRWEMAAPRKCQGSAWQHQRERNRDVGVGNLWFVILIILLSHCVLSDLPPVSSVLCWFSLDMPALLTNECGGNAPLTFPCFSTCMFLHPLKGNNSSLVCNALTPPSWSNPRPSVGYNQFVMLDRCSRSPFWYSSLRPFLPGLAERIPNELETFKIFF